MTVSWSPLTEATMGSALSFAGGVFGCSVGIGILPMRAVAPAATAAAPTPYFKKSLRDILLFESRSDSVFSSVFLFSFKDFCLTWLGFILNGFYRSPRNLGHILPG